MNNKSNFEDQDEDAKRDRTPQYYFLSRVVGSRFARHFDFVVRNSGVIPWSRVV